MLSKWAIKLGAATLFVATPAQAEEHPVILTGFSYFPAVLYADPGDTVRFINQSGESQTVVGKDVGWMVGPLAPNQEGTLVVTEETQLDFFSAYNQGGNTNSEEGSGNADDGASNGQGVGNWNDALVKARITFDQPPLK